MSKHTPGPWFSQYDDNGFYEIGSEAVGLRLAFTFGEGDTDEANVRLMSAAPDLLEALEALVTQVSDSHAYDELAVARAAIAKAKGEV